LELNGVAFPPGKIAPKLKGHQVGKDVMIEEAAQPVGIVTTNLKGFSHLMGRIAFSLHAGNGPDYSISDFWIFSHFVSPLLLIRGWSSIPWNSIHRSFQHALPTGFPSTKPLFILSGRKGGRSCNLSRKIVSPHQF
jgi:hypothetical protein